jgi:putative hemolysin
MSTSSRSLPTRHPLNARLTVALADGEEDLRRAMNLRYRVFGQEMGARLGSEIAQIDRDRFDEYCEHMLVKDTASGAVVGYSRILTDEGMAAVGEYYSQTEFDLSEVLDTGLRYMEVGRTCVDPHYRGGAVMALLWSGLARFMDTREIDVLMGCASISLNDGGYAASAAMAYLRESHMSSPGQRAYPRLPLPRRDSDLVGKDQVPPLLQAYLRAGAVVCSEPYWDRSFDVADVFIMLERKKINHRYLRHFLSEGRPT